MDINTVFLKDMSFSLAVGKDAWQRDKVQPVNVTLEVNNVKSIYGAAADDDVSQSLDYGKLYKNIQSRLPPQKHCSTVREIGEQLLEAISQRGVGSSIEITLPKAVLRAEGGLRYTCETSNINALKLSETLHLCSIRCACIIGVNPHERNCKQMVLLDLTFRQETEEDRTKSSAENDEANTDMSVGIAVRKYDAIVEKVVEVSPF